MQIAVSAPTLRGNPLLLATKKQLADLDCEVTEWLANLRDDPDARVRSRQAFYRKYGAATHDEYGYGNSELAFMHWEERGVLRPQHVTPPGSRWWSEVNLRFIYYCELAVRCHEQQLRPPGLPAASKKWLDYLANPNPVTWYRAHNSSIIAGYLAHGDLAEHECAAERTFINVVLYRVLFAQSMVEGSHGLFRHLLRLFANPHGSAVSLITHLRDFYPRSYPLSEEDLHHLMYRAHDLGEVGRELMDEVLIHPQLTSLYRHASVWNDQPGLLGLIRKGQPAYPNGQLQQRVGTWWFNRMFCWIIERWSRLRHPSVPA